MTEDAAITQDAATTRQQRDQALACAGLSLTVVAAMLVSNFGSEPVELRRAEEAVRLHREMLTQHREILRVNEAVLAENRVELQRLRQAATPSPP